MRSDPLISVITICRNAEKHIRATMLSVLDQKYANIEYFIVDGNSSDETIKIVKEVSGRYPYRKIEIISERDSGIADAMNKGIRLASGEIIAHLHAGDRYIDSLILSKVAQSYIKDSWRWGVAGSVVVNASGKKLHIYNAEPDCKTLLKKNCIPHQSTFLVKDIFDTYGLFDVSYKQAMDYEYWLRIAFKGKERYRILPFNTTYFMDGGKSSNIFELLKYLHMLRKTLSGYGCKVTALDDLVFLSRVMVFYVFYELKKKLRIL